MSTNVMNAPPQARASIAGFRVAALTLLAATAAAIVLALAINGTGSGSTAPHDVNGVSSVSGVTLGRSPGMHPGSTLPAPPAKVAAATGSRPAVGPDESRIAASIGQSSPQVSSGPDESRIAASVSSR